MSDSRPDTPHQSTARAAARGLGRRARRAVAGTSPPSGELGIRRPQSGYSAKEEAAILDLVLRTGEALVATGAPVAETTVALQRMMAGVGVVNAQVEIMFTSITVTIERDEAPMTRVRVIQGDTADYTRLSELLELVAAVGAGTMPVEQAHERLDQVLQAPHPYRRGLVTLALAAMAAGVALLLGGGWQVAALAAGTTAVIDRTLRFFRHRGLPRLFQQALGAAIATVVALGLLWGQEMFGWSPTLLPPALVVASGIVVLLAGLSLVGAAQDAISGFPLTAAARSYELVLNTVGLVVGIGLVLDVGRRLGIPLAVGELSSFSGATAVRILCGAVIAAAFAIASYSQLRVAGWAAVVGALGVAVNDLAGLTGLGASSRAFVAALIVGLAAALIRSWTAVPAMVLTVCGITPMLPGLTIYAAMFGIVESGNILSGANLMVQALGIGLALAAGVTLGGYVASWTPTPSDIWQKAMRRRAGGSRI